MDNWGPERGGDSLKVTQQARRTRDELQARDLSTKSWKNKAIQRRGRHLFPGILPPAGRTSVPHNNALLGSLFPPSFPLKRADLPRTLLTPRAAVRAGASRGLGQNPEMLGKRGGATEGRSA